MKTTCHKTHGTRPRPSRQRVRSARRPEIRSRAARGAGAALALVAALAVACSESESTVSEIRVSEAVEAQPPSGATEAPAQGPRALGLRGIRQLTFAGRRSGEGYFDPTGTRMVFQSEREPGNPFYQIYLMDLETGDTRRVSPGIGKTTCAWIHPSGERVLFASTHADPRAEEKQREELKRRASGEERRYSWDYDPSYELYAAPLSGGPLVQLTDAEGYDAEASYSPDGDLVVFASNRHAFTEALSEEDAARFAEDPSSQLDLYLMNADGSNVRRLTETPGYDGGPFFSPDGTRIIWRRFSLDGATAEVHSMRIDGSDEQVLTQLGAMSWAPFYHPSGDYAIFATNLLGFSNFELYLVSTDPAAPGDPVRVTDMEGFDGLPVFLPDGQRLAWTRRPGSGSAGSQIYLAEWDDAAARRALGISKAWSATVRVASPPAVESAAVERIRSHVEALTAPEMGGRLPGTPGARAATTFVAEAFEELGLAPAGSDGFFQPFEFTAGISLGDANALRLERDATDAESFELVKGWLPLSFSQTGSVEPTPVVFAGYGISAPEPEHGEPYDSYGDVDVEGRWVLVFRYLPDDIPPKRRQALARYASLRRKVMQARDRGALGVLFVSGPLAKFKDRVVGLGFDGAVAGASSVFALSLDDAVGDALLRSSGRDLEALQRELEQGGTVEAFELPGVRVSARVDLVQEKRTARNVLARLDVPGPPDAAPLVIGAHLDHLGTGEGGNSLARGEERGTVHPGADDNASGVAVLIEVAARLARDRSELEGRDVWFAAWSAEEMGLLGSEHFVADLPAPAPHSLPAPPRYAAYFNMDMVGRLDDSVYVQGIGSSTAWAEWVESANAGPKLPLVLQNDSYLPTDSTSFYLKGIPVLSLFTGVHEEYHTPRDTADKLVYEGSARIARLVEVLARQAVAAQEPPDYVAMDRDERGPARVNIRAFLGTIPSYGRSDVVGVLLAGVAQNGPAARAGLRADDVIVELAGRAIENIYDYTYALEALEIGEPVTVVVRRGSERISLEITPESRD